MLLRRHKFKKEVEVTVEKNPAVEKEVEATVKQIKVLLDEKGIEYKDKANKAELLALLSESTK